MPQSHQCVCPISISDSVSSVYQSHQCTRASSISASDPVPSVYLTQSYQCIWPSPISVSDRVCVLYIESVTTELALMCTLNFFVSYVQLITIFISRCTMSMGVLLHLYCSVLWARHFRNFHYYDLFKGGQPLWTKPVLKRLVSLTVGWQQLEQSDHCCSL